MEEDSVGPEPRTLAMHGTDEYSGHLKQEVHVHVVTYDLVVV